MKTKHLFLVWAGVCLLSCRKEQTGPPPSGKSAADNSTLTLGQAKQWYGSQIEPASINLQATGGSFYITDISVPWANAKSLINKDGNYWLVPIEGTPVYNKVKQGFRKLAIMRDSTGAIQARMLEFIPDGLYFQRAGRTTTADYTGRIFVFDQSYHLLSGWIMASGKVIGGIKASSGKADSSATIHTDYVAAVPDCHWVDENYIDSRGEVVVYSEQICTATGAGGPTAHDFDPGGGDIAGHEGGGNGGSGIPPVSNLPGEAGPSVNAKSLMDCFTNVPDAGASMKITVYVQEPFPGTTFNIGPNSVGHVAIGLTKTNGSQSITQVVGYYPDATGASKFHCPAKIVNNGGDLNYNVSVSYTVTAAKFDLIRNYISNPPTTYDLLTFNCTNFVYNACLAGGVQLPNPTNTVGLGGPGGSTTAMAPAGLGDSIEKLNGANNVNLSGGTTPNSKGPCN